MSKSFSGVTIDDFIDFIKSLLRKNPKNIILHIGMNNLNKKPKAIKKKMIDLVSTIQNTDPPIQITVSGITIRKD